MKSNKIHVEQKEIWILQEKKFLEYSTHTQEFSEVSAFTNLTRLWKALAWYHQRKILKYQLFLNRETAVERAVDSYAVFYKFLRRSSKSSMKKHVFYPDQKQKNTLTIFKVKLNQL